MGTFKRKVLLVSAHINELIKFNKVNDSGRTELRELYERIESNVAFQRQ